MQAADCGRAPTEAEPTGRGVLVRDAAQAALALGVARALGQRRPLLLVSPPGAAAWMGAPLFLAGIAAAQRLVPEVPAAAVLDCGAAPGLALAALGLPPEAPLVAVILDPGCPAWGAVASVAAAQGRPLWRATPPCLDLGGAPLGRPEGPPGDPWCGGPAQLPPAGLDAENTAKIARNRARAVEKIGLWLGHAAGDSHRGLR